MENEKKLSSATIRASQYKMSDASWSTGFSYMEVYGLGYEEGVHRRDPSSVLTVGDKFYVWYTKSTGPYFGSCTADPLAKKFPWDYADIWYATSSDGIHWDEQGPAVCRGGKGEYDERTVCTPDVMEHEGRYYLVYQAIPQGTYSGCEESVAMAYADSPDGPWIKTNRTLVSPREQGHWFDADGSYNDDEFLGLCHDPSLFYYRDKFYLYYKCGAGNTHLKMAEMDTRWGVAIADDVFGPYVPSEYNPVTNSGHETMLWKYKGGIACLLNRDGIEKDTIQYAPDGINFEVMGVTYDTPMAGGTIRGRDNDIAPLEGLRWGLCHYDERGSMWNYILRFDTDKRHPYIRPHRYPDANTTRLDDPWALRYK